MAFGDAENDGDCMCCEGRIVGRHFVMEQTLVSDVGLRESLLKLRMCGSCYDTMKADLDPEALEAYGAAVETTGLLDSLKKKFEARRKPRLRSHVTKPAPLQRMAADVDHDRFIKFDCVDCGENFVLDAADEESVLNVDVMRCAKCRKPVSTAQLLEQLGDTEYLQGEDGTLYMVDRSTPMKRKAGG